MLFQSSQVLTLASLLSSALVAASPVAIDMTGHPSRQCTMSNKPGKNYRLSAVAICDPPTVLGNHVHTTCSDKSGVVIGTVDYWSVDTDKKNPKDPKNYIREVTNVVLTPKKQGDPAIPYLAVQFWCAPEGEDVPSLTNWLSPVYYTPQNGIAQAKFTGTKGCERPAEFYLVDVPAGVPCNN